LFPLDDACLERQLVDCAGECLASDGLVDPAQLEQHATWLDVCDPPLRRTLTGTHAGFGRLLGQRTVGEHVDPYLAATLDVTGHGDTCCLDLAVRDVRRRDGLDAVLTERHRGATRRVAGAARVVLLAVLDLAWNKHCYASPPAAAATGAASARGARGGRRSLPP